MAEDSTKASLIPERLQHILGNDTRAFAHLALVRKDGTPHVSPVWFEWDGEHIVINTARGRVKDRILQRKPVVSMSIQDPADSYRYLLITGPVVEETEEGGFEHICDLQQKYHGNRDYPKVPGQVRVIYKVRPERVFASKK